MILSAPHTSKEESTWEAQLPGHSSALSNLPLAHPFLLSFRTIYFRVSQDWTCQIPGPKWFSEVIQNTHVDISQMRNQKSRDKPCPKSDSSTLMWLRSDFIRSLDQSFQCLVTANCHMAMGILFTSKCKRLSREWMDLGLNSCFTTLYLKVKTSLPISLPKNWGSKTYLTSCVCYEAQVI